MKENKEWLQNDLIKLFGTKSEREIKKLSSEVDKINFL